MKYTTSFGSYSKADKNLIIPSSQICSHCGASTDKKSLNIRKFDCPHCGKKDIDRDINASVNIKNYGLGQVDNRNTV